MYGFTGGFDRQKLTSISNKCTQMAVSDYPQIDQENKNAWDGTKVAIKCTTEDCQLMANEINPH